MPVGCWRSTSAGADSAWNALFEYDGAIYDGAHNAYLAEVAVATRARVQPFRRAQFRNLGRLLARTLKMLSDFREHGRRHYGAGLPSSLSDIISERQAPASLVRWKGAH